jgi:hypothetical protein
MRALGFVSLCGFLLAIASCGSSSNDSGSIDQKCEQACQAIQAACMSAESDCGQECSEDLADCPTEMGAVLDCILANQSQLQCDPEEDQGLAEAPCEAQHAAVHAAPCEKDPF